MDRAADFAFHATESVGMEHTAYLALGANLGDCRRTLGEAAARIARMPRTALRACSNLYETAPVGGPPGQPDYLNAVVRVETGLPPHELLAACLEIERSLGRERSVLHGPRTLDLDLLLYGTLVLDTPELTVPHPRLHTRGFVLRPLADLDPGLIHPKHLVSIQELLERLPGGESRTVRHVGDSRWGPAGNCGGARAGRPHGNRGLRLPP